MCRYLDQSGSTHRLSRCPLFLFCCLWKVYRMSRLIPSDWRRNRKGFWRKRWRRIGFHSCGEVTPTERGNPGGYRGACSRPLGSTYRQPGASPFTDDGEFLMDSKVASCRSLYKPLTGNEGTLQYYMIDGFIVSKNIRVESYEVKDLGFINSDHNPQILKVVLE